MSQCEEAQAVQAKAVKSCVIIVLCLTLLWGCFFATVAMAAEQRPSQGLADFSGASGTSPLSPALPPAPSLTPSLAASPTALPGPSSGAGSRTYQRTPAKTAVPAPPTPPAVSRPEERRGKYSNPYDRSVPLQGDTHKGYAPARRDAFRR